MMNNIKKKRIELALISQHSLEDCKAWSPDYYVANIYIKVSGETISQTRADLIDLGYTTRLMVVIDNGIKSEWIFGKLKGGKGVFNLHCKNSVWRGSPSDFIGVSSNNGDAVLIDDENVKKGERAWHSIV